MDFLFQVSIFIMQSTEKKRYAEMFIIRLPDEPATEPAPFVPPTAAELERFLMARLPAAERTSQEAATARALAEAAATQASIDRELVLELPPLRPNGGPRGPLLRAALPFSARSLLVWLIVFGGFWWLTRFLAEGLLFWLVLVAALGNLIRQTRSNYRRFRQYHSLQYSFYHGFVVVQFTTSNRQSLIRFDNSLVGRFWETKRLFCFRLNLIQYYIDKQELDQEQARMLSCLLKKLSLRPAGQNQAAGHDLDIALNNKKH